jgi:hypothetical protein
MREGSLSRPNAFLSFLIDARWEEVFGQFLSRSGEVLPQLRIPFRKRINLLIL